MKALLTALYLLCGISVATAQSPVAGDMLSRLEARFPEQTQRLVLLPHSIRSAVFRVSVHNEKLADLVRLHRNIQAHAQTLLAEAPPKLPMKVTALLLYPQLIIDLAKDGSLDPLEINLISAPYPEPIRKYSREIANLHIPLLAELYRIIHEAQWELKRMTVGYGLPTIAAYRELFDQPHIIPLLVKNPAFTKQLRETYLWNPWITERWAEEKQRVLAFQQVEARPVAKPAAHKVSTRPVAYQVPLNLNPRTLPAVAYSRDKLYRRTAPAAAYSYISPIGYGFYGVGLAPYGRYRVKNIDALPSEWTRPQFIRPFR